MNRAVALSHLVYKLKFVTYFDEVVVILNNIVSIDCIPLSLSLKLSIMILLLLTHSVILIARCCLYFRTNGLCSQHLVSKLEVLQLAANRHLSSTTFLLRLL